MSYSMDPPHLIGLGERMRRSFDDLDEVARGLQRAADSAALALVRTLPAHGALVELNCDVGLVLLEDGLGEDARHH